MLTAKGDAEVVQGEATVFACEIIAQSSQGAAEIPNSLDRQQPKDTLHTAECGIDKPVNGELEG
jgi:hypothetical protein